MAETERDIILKLVVLLAIWFLDPMRSRVAPPKPRVARQLQINDPLYNVRDYYVLTKERLDQIRQEKLYPFYDYDMEGRRGDLVTEINDNSAQVQKQLNFLLPYFGFGFNYTWVTSFQTILHLFTFQPVVARRRSGLCCWSWHLPFVDRSLSTDSWDSVTPWSIRRCLHCSSRFKPGPKIKILRSLVRSTAAVALVASRKVTWIKERRAFISGESTLMNDVRH